MKKKAFRLTLPGCSQAAFLYRIEKPIRRVQGCL